MTIIILNICTAAFCSFRKNLAVLMNLYLRISCCRQDAIINPHYTDRQTQAQKGQITQVLIAGIHKWQTGDNTNPCHDIL